MKKTAYWVALILVASFISCKKDSTTSPTYYPGAGGNIHPSGDITTIAGNGTQGYSGDGGAATSAELYTPWAVAVDASGNIYIADIYNSRIRKVSTDGTISTFAGNGTLGFSGDGGPATSAELAEPTGISIDGSGNAYIADEQNNRIRKVSTGGVISTFAGGRYIQGLGDGGPADSAQLNNPTAVAIDNAGNVYIADFTDERIRKVNTRGIITTIAGNGNQGYSGDGGPATSAELNWPSGVAVDASGNIYIADENNNRVRKVNTNNIIITIAGNGMQGYSGDGQAATNEELDYPSEVTVDRAGNIYIADEFNNRIRLISPGDIINTIAGDGSYGYSGDGGLATSAQLSNPVGVAVDASGNIYIADANNNRIRKVYK